MSIPEVERAAAPHAGARLCDEARPAPTAAGQTAGAARERGGSRKSRGAVTRCASTARRRRLRETAPRPVDLIATHKASPNETERFMTPIAPIPATAHQKAGSAK